MDYFYIVGSFQ